MGTCLYIPDWTDAKYTSQNSQDAMERVRVNLLFGVVKVNTYNCFILETHVYSSVNAQSWQKL